MNTLRFIAHIAFGISLAGTFGKIPLAADWVRAEYFGFVLIFGALLSHFGEWCQWTWNDSLQPHAGHKYQPLDAFKNYVGVCVGSLLLQWTEHAFLPCLVVLIGIIGYAIACLIKKRPI